MIPSLSPSINTTLRLWLISIVEWLLLLPVWVVLQAYFQTGETVVPWMYTLPLQSMAGVLLRRICNRRWKQLLASVMIGVAAGLLTAGWSVFSLPLIAGNCASAFFGLTVVTRIHRLRFFLIGLGLYLAATIAFIKIPLLEPNLALLTWSGSLCLVLALLDTNTSYLRYNSFPGEAARLPAGIQRLNRLYVIGFIALAAALAAGGGKVIGMLFLNTVRTIFGWISRLFNGTEEVIEPAAAPPAPAPEFPAGEVQEPGLLSMIFNILFYVLGAAAVLAVLYYGLRWLYRNSGGLFRRAVDALLAMLRKASPQETSPYQDEEESIFAWEKTVQGFRDYWRSRLIPGKRRDRWDNMNSSRERARWLYRQWLTARRSEGYEVKGYLTPQETGKDVARWAGGRSRQPKGGNDATAAAASEELLCLYNQARYGVAEPDSSEIINLKDKLKL